MVIFSKTQQTHTIRLCYISSISYFSHIFVWIMLPVFPSDPLGACWKISRSNFWKSSYKNLFNLKLHGFESRLGHLSFITYLLLIMTIVFCILLCFKFMFTGQKLYLFVNRQYFISNLLTAWTKCCIMKQKCHIQKGIA